jgi:hypothetical protein
MTATDMVGMFIDRLVERRYGAPFSAKRWTRHHAQLHAPTEDGRTRSAQLACPECPDAAELGRRLLAGHVIYLSYNDFDEAIRAAYKGGVGET